jgi:hypothetical protein
MGSGKMADVGYGSRTVAIVVLCFLSFSVLLNVFPFSAK